MSGGGGGGEGGGEHSQNWIGAKSYLFDQIAENSHL